MPFPKLNFDETPFLSFHSPSSSFSSTFKILLQFLLLAAEAVALSLVAFQVLPKMRERNGRVAQI